jgi:hypothetical protein
MKENKTKTLLRKGKVATFFLSNEENTDHFVS